MYQHYICSVCQMSMETCVDPKTRSVIALFVDICFDGYLAIKDKLAWCDPFRETIFILFVNITLRRSLVDRLVCV